MQAYPALVVSTTGPAATELAVGTGLLVIPGGAAAELAVGVALGGASMIHAGFHQDIAWIGMSIGGDFNLGPLEKAAKSKGSGFEGAAP